MKKLLITMWIMCFGFCAGFAAIPGIAIISQKMIRHEGWFSTYVTSLCINGYQFVSTSNGSEGGSSIIQVFDANHQPAKCTIKKQTIKEDEYE